MPPFADVSTDVKAGLERIPVLLSQTFSSRCRTEFCVHLSKPSERVSLHLFASALPQCVFYGRLYADAEFVSDLFIQ